MVKENLIVTETGYGHHHHNHRCISWSAIFAGTFVGLGLGFLLHVYSIAISLSAYSSSTQGAEVIAIGGLIGMIIGVIAAMGTAGFVSGYLGRKHHHHTMSNSVHHSSHFGIIYGFITWSLILLITALSAGPLMDYATSYKNSLAHTINMNADNNAAVNVTSDEHAPAIKQTRDNQTVAQVSPTQLAWGGWLVFILFFIGAISSCIGAGCGIQCNRSHECADDVSRPIP